MPVLLRCIKGGGLADRFTLGRQYELKLGCYITDNYGVAWLCDAIDIDYEFEVVK